MRKGWQNEIEKMPADRAQWFQQQQAQVQAQQRVVSPSSTRKVCFKKNTLGVQQQHP